MDSRLSLSPHVAGGEHSRMTDEQISRKFIIFRILSSKYLKSTAMTVNPGVITKFPGRFTQDALRN